MRAYYDEDDVGPADLLRESGSEALSGNQIVGVAKNVLALEIVAESAVKSVHEVVRVLVTV
jgi:hypothetical protein